MVVVCFGVVWGCLGGFVFCCCLLWFSGVTKLFQLFLLFCSVFGFLADSSFGGIIGRVLLWSGSVLFCWRVTAGNVKIVGG